MTEGASQATGLGSAEAPEPHSGLRPTGAIPSAGMPRPKKSDPAIVAYAANMVAERIVEEWDATGDADEWAKSLAKEMRYSHRGGYELARELERYHRVSPDSQLVEILDDAGYALDDAYADALEKWVKLTGWTPAFAKGDRVTWRGKTGIVNDIKEKVAEYYFSPDDEAWRFANGGGYIVTEDALTASAIEAATAGETTQIGSTEGESAAPSGETPRTSHDGEQETAQ